MEQNEEVNEENGFVTKTTGGEDVVKPCSQPIQRTYCPVFVFLKITEPQTNDSVTKYKIISQKDSEEKKREVWRQYEDFEWLQHSILTQTSLHGIVVPPLPVREGATQRAAELTPTRRPRTDAGEVETEQPADKEVEGLERYLQLLVVHPVFGSTNLLNDFLTQEQPATRSKVRKGFMDMLSQAVDYKVDHKSDPEEDLQREYEKHLELISNLRECSNTFADAVLAQQRIAVACGHLSSTLVQTVPFYSTTFPTLVHYFKIWSSLCDEAKACILDGADEDDRTLGSLLEHYTKYMENSKAMLDRRLKLFGEFDEAIRAVEKAKPHKKESAEEGRSIAAAAFEQCTDVARRELKEFHRTRLLATQDALVRHAESRLLRAREAHQLVDQTLNKLRSG